MTSHQSSSSIRNKIAGAFAIIGGVLLVIGGSKGIADFLAHVQTYVNDYLGANPLVALAFKILIALALLGGLTVILGGVLIWKNFPWLGKFMIFLGASMGLIGLCFTLVAVYLIGGAPGVTLYFQDILKTLTGLGVIFTIIASLVAS
jgi:hypothetical protein